MLVKGIIDCDFVNYKKPVLTIEFPYCNMKCDKLNGAPVCQNSTLQKEPNIEISGEEIWKLYEKNPITKGFCFQGLEPFDSLMDVAELLNFIRRRKNCSDVIVIYTGYNKGENFIVENIIRKYHNIIIKWGRYIIGHEPHYDEILGVKLSSDNQYAEEIK